jgi:hypothetical protein
MRKRLWLLWLAITADPPDATVASAKPSTSAGVTRSTSPPRRRTRRGFEAAFMARGLSPARL